MRGEIFRSGEVYRMGSCGSEMSQMRLRKVAAQCQLSRPSFGQLLRYLRDSLTSPVARHCYPIRQPTVDFTFDPTGRAIAELYLRWERAERDQSVNLTATQAGL